MGGEVSVNILLFHAYPQETILVRERVLYVNDNTSIRARRPARYQVIQHGRNNTKHFEQSRAEYVGKDTNSLGTHPKSMCLCIRILMYQFVLQQPLNVHHRMKKLLISE